MPAGEFWMTARDGAEIFVRSFLPADPPKALVQLAHGMAEHSGRYARFAERVTAAGCGLYAADHRGHGKTARSDADFGFFAEHDGWAKVVGDQEMLLDELGRRHERVPVVFMGHSMGSFVVRELAIRRGGDAAGMILSGTSHDSPWKYRLLRLITLAERLRLGPRGSSALIRWLSFGRFNKQFVPARTEYDWLSRDEAEVDRHVADPLCGFYCATGLWADLLEGMAGVCEPKRMARMPEALPVYVMAGERDPVHHGLTGIQKLRRALERAGMEDVTVRIYDGARHELLNETNRDEVTRDLLAWLESRTG